MQKVLIANRGEIAVRIIRACHDLGLQTVAVYSQADTEALHVLHADEAVCIGEAPAHKSYLKIPNILSACEITGADAIHPGYGFLSEKAHFSKACAENGIIFLGPKPKSIEQMGDKIEARIAAAKAKVPMVPGTQEPLKDVDEAKSLAKRMGYPILLKATAGGGGKGMRVVEKEGDIASAFERASSEALKAFGDGQLYIEKYLKKARHIEIQVACDMHGNSIHLFERECSLQRRHQKVIEEAPSPFLNQATRDKMTEAALRLCKDVNYSGVGTIEFLVDEEQNFYFLEMNTRLQVEHPVTEMITGVDLVELQIRIGEGEKLPIKQSDLKINGAAVECRLYAEDPENNFMPSPGTIHWMTIPEGPGVRHDTAVYPGAAIPIYYDPMIAKLITWGSNRNQAIVRMQRAMQEYEIGGFKNNIGFLRTILFHPEFHRGNIYTRFIEDHPELMKVEKSLEGLPPEVLVGIAAFMREENKNQTSGVQTKSEAVVSPWKLIGLTGSLRK